MRLTSVTIYVDPTWSMRPWQGQIQPWSRLTSLWTR